MITIRTFDPSEWRQYRDTRLKALQDSPDAFGSTFETTSQLADIEWKDRLLRISPEQDLPLAGLIDGQFEAMAWARIEPPGSHLYQMWVSPTARRKGLARQLLMYAIDWAQVQGASQMVLGVTCGNTPARQLYESIGFVPVGLPEPLRVGSSLQTQSMTYRFV